MTGQFVDGQIVRERFNPHVMWTLAPHLFRVQSGYAIRLSEGSQTRIDQVQLASEQLLQNFEPIDPLLEAVIRENLKEGS